MTVNNVCCKVVEDEWSVYFDMALTMLEALGGIDLCLGGLGINGHVAFNEAAEPDDTITADAFAALGTRVLPISRETKTINVYDYQRCDLRGMPNGASQSV